MLLFFVPTAFLVACAPNTVAPLREAEICFQDEGELILIREELKSISAGLGAKIVDRSADASEELKQIAKNASNAPGWYYKPLLILRIERPDGAGLSATNAGIENGVLITFSEGRNHLDAVRFADTIVAGLGASWNVRELKQHEATPEASRCTASR